MQMNYTLNEQDYIDFNLFHLKTSKTMKRSVFLQRIMGPLVFIIAIFVATKVTQRPIWIWTAIFSVLSVLWYLSYPKRIEKEVTGRIVKMLSEGENRSLLGKQTLKTNEDGVTLSSEFETKAVRWHVFNKVEMTENHLFIYNSSISAYIIPTSVFNNIEEKNTFYEEVRTRIQQD